MSDDMQMQETMNQIYGADANQGQVKSNLKIEITKIEDEIKAAQKIVQLANDEESSMLGVSPELANERQRDIVFLKRKLEKTKTELEEIQ